MTLAEPENLTQELTQEGRVVMEPGYLAYLRTEGYQIDAIEDIDVIESGSEREKYYLVAEIKTFDKRQDNPSLDYVNDRITLRICSCWSWRSNSADLSDGEKPSECGGCKHTRRWNREERAAEDDQQEELV
jgi:hypothetical protein